MINTPQECESNRCHLPLIAFLIITVASLLGAAPAPDVYRTKKKKKTQNTKKTLQSVWTITKNQGDITSSRLGINEVDDSYGYTLHLKLYRGIINDL